MPVRSIMVVDDSKDNLQFLEYLLENANYHVRSAPSGKLAIRSMAASLPDLLIVDVTMPEMDGYEFCRIIKQEPRSALIPVLFVTGLDKKEVEVKAKQVGAQGVVCKPYQIKELLSIVETILNKNDS